MQNMMQPPLPILQQPEPAPLEQQMKDFFYHQYQAFMQQLTHPESPSPKAEDHTKVNNDGM